MTPEDVYQQWKSQRSTIEVSADFDANVMSRLAAEADVVTSELTSTTGRLALLDRPLWGALAVVAASVVGIVRLSFALLVVLF
jgi:hypothetical protein